MPHSNGASIMHEVLRQFTALPAAGTQAKDLTNRDKLALCIAAGAEIETVMDGLTTTVRTVNVCGVVDRGDGGYVVAIGPRARFGLEG